MRRRQGTQTTRRSRLRGERGAGPKVRFLLLLLIASFGVWLFLPVPALTATVPPASRPPATDGLPWLSTQQQRIVDPQGRTVLLRGFNVNALLEPTMRPSPLDASDASLMQQAGFDVVRLPIAWSLLEPQRGSFDGSYLDRVAAAVSLLNAHHLYVVIDMHSLGWSPEYGGSGAPPWATVPGVPDPVWGPMPSVGRFLSPAINASTVYFWVTRDWQDEYLRVWQRVAARFRDVSGVAGYDVFNEPHSFPLPPLRFDKDQLFPFYARAITAIGAVDPNHLFFLDNDMFDAAAGWPTAVVPISAPSLVYAPHVYVGSLNPPSFTGDVRPLQENIAQLAVEASQLPGPMWVGEFSIDSSLPLAPQWIQGVLAELDARDAGWAWWQWRESSGWGARDATGTTLNMPLMHVLARPYLAAAARGVSSQITGSGPYTLVVGVPASVASAVDVAWPGGVWHAPETRSSCGAKVTWDAAAARVHIAVPAGETCTLTLAG